MKYYVTLDLPPELVKHIKFTAIEQDIRIKELVKRAIEQYLVDKIDVRKYFKEE